MIIFIINDFANYFHVKSINPSVYKIFKKNTHQFPRAKSDVFK